MKSKWLKKTVAIALALCTLSAVSCGKDTNNNEKDDNTSPTDAPATENVVIAGTDSGVVRDGTPKKYFTLSFDDGITQDEKIIEILKKYNMDCCTFNINTGLYGANWTWVGQQLGNPNLTHIRYTEDKIKSVYDGFDVEVHTLTHPSLKNYDLVPEKIREEVQGDADNIEEIFGIKPTGMAWPGGDTEYTDKTVELVLENTDIRWARAATTTHKYDLPEYFMKWQPTCGISEPNVITLARKFVRAEAEEDMLFYVWGHGYELDHNDSYDTFEQLVKIMSEAEDVVFVTNAEFYQLFKDEIPSWKE